MRAVQIYDSLITVYFVVNAMDEAQCLFLLSSGDVHMTITEVDS